MSDTPETDAIHYEEVGCLENKYALLVNCCREIERERNETIAKAEAIHQDRLKVVVKRDQWQDIANKLFEQLEQWGCQTTECFCECAVVMREFKQINKEAV
jgi:hypothetical protein